jgi:endoglucanase Acf2
LPKAPEDFVIGMTGGESFPDARVAGWSDWFVTAQYGAADKGFKVTFGHGSPYVFAQYTGGEPALTFGKAPEVLSGTDKDAVLSVRVGKRIYGLFAPTGSTWTGIGTDKLEAKTNGKGYFSVAVLPDDKPETLANFKAHAYSFVVDTKVTYKYEQAKGVVDATYAFETKAMEGQDKGTIFALYPHQWRVATADYTNQTYNSVRGPMKIAQGKSFKTATPLPPALPGLVMTPGVDKEKLKEYIATEMKGNAKLQGDTYWLGKSLGRWATTAAVAEQIGDEATVAECDRRMKAAMEGFFTANPGENQNVFAYEKNWGTLIGYPASYGSDDSLNDHHFHYGYFIRAAAEVARRDPDWVSDAKWGGMLKMLLRDFASPSRDDKMFPFMRNFDVYAGHTWASGNAKFADGNNNESSSEAINAWYGTMMLGELLGDASIRDLGAYCMATEVSAIEDYWFDVHEDLFPQEYPVTMASMIWGAKSVYATWFSGAPEAKHGINYLPVTAGSLYLGRFPDYVKKNYADMVAEKGSANWGQWNDVLWQYHALGDAAEALKEWNANPGAKKEEGNSLPAAYMWIAALNDLGTIDRTVLADAPFAATFVKDGKKTHVAWNLGKQPRTVRFSDGTTVDCPPGKPAMK